MRKSRFVPAIIFLVSLAAVMVACESTPEEYNLTIVSTEGGSVISPDEGTFAFKAGMEVNLTASPEKDYRFVRWTGDVDTVEDVYGSLTSITIKGNYVITAEFEQITDALSDPPAPPEWNPQKQALLPDREFDDDWTMMNNWYPALHRGISAIWTQWGSNPAMITSPDRANASTMLGLSEGHPPGDGPRILRYVFAKDLPGGVSLDLIVRLYDGDTPIGEWVEEDIPAAWTTREVEVTSEPSNWGNVRVELTRQGETAAPDSDLRRVLVSLVEMEIPYPEEFIFPYLNPATTTQSPGGDTVQRPPGVQEGDLIFVCSFDGEAPEGFTLIYAQPSIEEAPRPYELRTWWKRAGANEPDSYRFPTAEGLWAARISGAADRPMAAAGHVEPTSDSFVAPLGISAPSVEALENSLILRISANSGYITWTEPHQWIAWDEWPCTAASWRFQREAGPTGEEYHGTGSFIHWVVQTIAIAPQE